MSLCLRCRVLVTAAVVAAGLLVFPAVSRAQSMPAADAALLHAQSPAIATEAAFFGYDLSLPGWSASEQPCPLMPGYLLLQYRRRSARRDARWLFTALAPRHGGRVYVVPVLYGNATPYKRAAGSQHSLEVFNQAVTSAVAARALQPDGSWLDLGLCYAELLGGTAEAISDSNREAGELQAPSPTLDFSAKGGNRAVVFSQRSGPGRYTVWTIAFDRKGRAIAASAVNRAETAAPTADGKAPRWENLPSGTKPPETPVAPAAAPQPTPLPQ